MLNKIIFTVIIFSSAETFSAFDSGNRSLTQRVEDEDRNTLRHLNDLLRVAKKEQRLRQQDRCRRAQEAAMALHFKNPKDPLSLNFLRSNQ